MHYLFLFGAGLSLLTQTNTTATAEHPQMIVPAYSYPSKNSPYWSKLQEKTDTVAYTILNQNNGDFTEKDSNYERLFKENTQKGLKNIAYVHLSYGERSIDDIEANIDNYLDLYGKENIKGFFLDETDTLTEGGREQLRDLKAYIKSIDQDLVVVANRGTSVTDEAYDDADIFCTYEGSAKKYLGKYRKNISSWESDPERAKKAMHIVYQAKPSDYDAILQKAKERHVPYIFITSDGSLKYHKTRNFFDELPTQFDTLTSLMRK
jgi:putative uncharacterized protein (fragment)